MTWCEKKKKKQQRKRGERRITADDIPEREGKGIERGSEGASDRVALPQPWGLSGCRA